MFAAMRRSRTAAGSGTTIITTTSTTMMGTASRATGWTACDGPLRGARASEDPCALVQPSVAVLLIDRPARGP